MKNQYFVYLLTNKNNTTLYTGMTKSLIQRIHQHKRKAVKGFSSRYNLNKLVYYEAFSDPKAAIKEKKVSKIYSEAKKKN